jgi:hypothetical protein
MIQNNEVCSNCAHFVRRQVLNTKGELYCNHHREGVNITQPDYQYCGAYENKIVKLRNDKIENILQ